MKPRAARFTVAHVVVDLQHTHQALCCTRCYGKAPLHRFYDAQGLITALEQFAQEHSSCRPQLVTRVDLRANGGEG